MRKIIALSFGVLSMNSFSQNDIQVFNLNNRASSNISDNNINIQRQSIQAVQTFASNVQLKRTSVKAVNKVKIINTVNTVKANPVNTVKPQVRRRRVSPQRNINTPIQVQQPLPQINFINTPPQMNPVSQLAQNSELGNLGNSFGNEQVQVQEAAPNEDEQVGRAGDFLEGISLDLNLPKMNVRTRSTSTSSSTLSASYKLMHFKNKFVKINRKMKGKMSFKKRLRLKVDNCFKW